ncbi:hypothetical protein TeGR_g14058, partial [Tetraparma gracilis]
MVKVFVRLRPSPSPTLSLVPPASLLSPPATLREFDGVFPAGCATSEVSSAVTAGVAEALLDGYNVTILAYGPTGTGKTHTMGTDFSPASGDAVMPTAVSLLFAAIAASPAATAVHLSYLEVYNEHLNDLLLPPTSTPPPLDIHETPGRDVRVPNLTSLPVASAERVFELLSAAAAGRKTAATAANAASSRSHAIVSLAVASTAPGEGGAKVSGRLALVDLAGSERQKRTGAAGGRLREGIGINKGLFVLGQCMSALADGAEQAATPPPPAAHPGTAHPGTAQRRNSPSPRR